MMRAIIAVLAFAATAAAGRALAAAEARPPRGTPEPSSRSPRCGRGTGALPMAKSDEYRAKAEECRLMAAKVTTSIDKAAWLELATHWLGLIRDPARTASERFHAMERDRGTRQQKSSAEH